MPWWSPGWPVPWWCYPSALAFECSGGRVVLDRLPPGVRAAVLLAAVVGFLAACWGLIAVVGYVVVQVAR